MRPDEYIFEFVVENGAICTKPALKKSHVFLHLKLFNTGKVLTYLPFLLRLPSLPSIEFKTSRDSSFKTSFSNFPLVNGSKHIFKNNADDTENSKQEVTW
jgi:hypothetical protein